MNKFEFLWVFVNGLKLSGNKSDKRIKCLIFVS